MCGKFTALASWAEVVAFSQPLTEGDRGGDAPGEGGSNDEIVTLRVGALLPVIVWDSEAGARRIVKMRWGFPDPRDWRRPRPMPGPQRPRAVLKTMEGVNWQGAPEPRAPRPRKR
jgi:hypothetical protein